MKRFHLLLSLIALLTLQSAFAQNPDSAYVFSYATAKNRGGNGLHYAWSVDGKRWQGIGPEFRFLFSDYGNWGEQKRLIDPFLLIDQQGRAHCFWSLNETVGQLAYAPTNDLFTWDSQLYPEVMTDGNVLMLEASFQPSTHNYLITWLSEKAGVQKVFKTTTTNFKTYTSTIEGQPSDRLNSRVEVLIDGEKQRGTISKVPWTTIEEIIKWYEWSKYREQLYTETLRDDASRFAQLTPVDANITVEPQGQKSISDMLLGVFFEDINYAADGGLYAELIQNRGFEYALSDKKNQDVSWNPFKAWTFSGAKENFVIDSIAPIHPNQKHYAELNITQIGETLANEGFDGISLKKGEKYNFSTYARGSQNSKGKLLIRLVDSNGKVYAEGITSLIGSTWKKYELVLTVSEMMTQAQLQIIPQFTGKLALDMVSLFPQNTFKGRKNGLRSDLAQTIADLKPRFVRFPGGCVAHGDGIDNIYRWKNTVGSLETRTSQRNLWGYNQSMGLGYFEYFQFCEDIGAEPLPVLAAGVPCQNSSCGGYGQQGGVPMCQMDAYVQDILDLIEWANGDKNSKWGKIRAQAGHPEPFNLKYIGIGNEDLITDIFEERFTMIYQAVRTKYPQMTVIGTVGPFSEGTDYRVGWELATKLQIPIVDEHYYQPPGWYLNNQDYYDKYDRAKSKVYLGEYAAHVPGRRMNIETALCEALHLCNVERNGDVVSMTSFAPLLAKDQFTQWNPDLIYFNNTEVKPTVDYYVQKLFGQNAGDAYIPSQISLTKDQKDVKKRMVSSLVYDSKTGDYILKLVNLLPVEVKSSINLANLQIISGSAVVTVLQGEIADEKAQPQSSTVQVSAEFDYSMPAYSFSVIRMKSTSVNR